MSMSDTLEVIWCRTFQAVLKIGNYFMGYRMPTYLEGPGKIKELGGFLKQKNINDVLVVTGSGMLRRGQVQPLLDGFAAAGIRYNVQAFDHPDPSSDDEVLGFDCGPGNVLMDAWLEKVNHVRYDQDAVWARSGKVIPQLLESLKQEKFFSLVPPKSTGRELFNLPWLEARLNGEKPEDVQRTLVSFTAETVTDAIRNFAPHVKELRVCGGGAKNPLMISELALLNPELVVTTTADLGVDPQDVEGLAFAWLAYRFDRRESGNLPSATGASGSRILGCLYPA